MLLKTFLTVTRMWIHARVALGEACHVDVNRNRERSGAIISEKPLRAGVASLDHHSS